MLSEHCCISDIGFELLKSVTILSAVYQRYFTVRNLDIFHSKQGICSSNRSTLHASQTMKSPLHHYTLFS